MQLKIYHSPRCSKSHECLKSLQEKGYNPEIILYLENPSTRAEIVELLKLLNLSPREIMRKKEAEYKDQNLDNQDLSDEELILAIINTPKLLERPIVVIDNKKAIIARPPEKILEYL